MGEDRASSKRLGRVPVAQAKRHSRRLRETVAVVRTDSAAAELHPLAEQGITLPARLLPADE